MEYQKIIKMWGSTPNQPSNFRARNLVEINDEAHRTYNTNSQLEFKTAMPTFTTENIVLILPAICWSH